jgi:hypothetical protein
MKLNLNQIYSVITKIDRRHIQLALVIVSLTLLALGAAAPAGFGDHGAAAFIR